MPQGEQVTTGARLEEAGTTVHQRVDLERSGHMHLHSMRGFGSMWLQDLSSLFFAFAVSTGFRTLKSEDCKNLNTTNSQI